MTSLSLSFREWAYPTKKKKPQRCAWGECGFLAHSYGNCVTVYSNEIGRFSPMYMWCPFNHNISAMGWYDGSCTPSIVQPLLAVASDAGVVAVYDVRNRNILGQLTRKNDKIRVLKWSPFYRSRFYLGMQSGTLVCCQMDETVSPAIAVRAELTMSFPIDFIDIDPQTGTTIAAACKDGRFSIVSSILTAKTGDEFKTYSLEEGHKITAMSFSPSLSNFVIICTNKMAMLYSVSRKVTLPYMETEGVRFMSQPMGQTNRLIIGYDNAVALWENNGEKWIRISMTNFVGLANRAREALMYTALDDKVIVFTMSHWLTVIEEQRGMLFVAQRIRMMPAKPMDWDFRKGSIAFSMSDGQIMVTSWTPDAIIESTGTENAVSMDDLANIGRKAELTNMEKKARFTQVAVPPMRMQPQTPTFSMLMDSHELEVDIEQDEFEQNFDFSTSFVSVPASHAKKEPAVTRTAIKEDQKRVWDQLMADQRPSPGNQFGPSVLKLPTEVSVELGERPRTPSPSPAGEALCGNSCTLLLSFKVADYPLSHVKWAPGGRLITLGFHDDHNVLRMVDFKRRETTPLLQVQLNAINVPITDLAFTEARDIFCIIIGGMTAVFMTTSSRPEQIGSVNFKSPVIGTFAPFGTECVFISKDSTVFKLVVQKDSTPPVKRIKTYKLPKKHGVPTFITWRRQGLIVGTDQGKVYLSYGEKKGDYTTIVTLVNPVAFVGPCSPNSYLIVDNQKNGVVLSNRGNTPLKGLVKNIKLASDSTYLVKYAGYGRLSASGTTDQYVPLSPPCVSRCPLMQVRDRYQSQLASLKLENAEEAISACRLFGAVFIMRLIQAKQNPNRLAEHVSWHAGLISGFPEFTEWSIQLALRTGDTLTARNLLMMTPVDSPDYMANMARVALYDNTVVGDSVMSAVNSMINSRHVNDAISMLLSMGAVDVAVEKLMSLDRIREAALLLRMRREHDRNRDLVHTVARKLIDQRSLLLGLLLLSEGGFHTEMVGIIAGIAGPEMSHLLSFLDG